MIFPQCTALPSDRFVPATLHVVLLLVVEDGWQSMTDYGQDTADKCAAIDLRIDPIPGEEGEQGEEEHLASFRS